MRVLTHTVIEAEAGQPVKQLLHLWGISGTFLSRLKFRQAITVNGAPVTVRFVPCPGDVLAADVSDLPGEHPHIRPVDFPLDILYEDEDLLLINKPAGIAVHPAALTEETATIAGAAAHYLHSESFHAVNRLDRGTTGVMAVAKTGFIHARCMAMLHTDDFRREYRAVCEGIPCPADGDIDLPIARFALEALNIDRYGLDQIDNRILSTIIDKFAGGPVGLSTIATALGEDAGTLEEVYEPFLIKEGFLKRTPRGRETTDLAWRHLGRRRIADTGSLFDDLS